LGMVEALPLGMVESLPLDTVDDLVMDILLVERGRPIPPQNHIDRRTEVMDTGVEDLEVVDLEVEALIVEAMEVEDLVDILMGTDSTDVEEGFTPDGNLLDMKCIIYRMSCLDYVIYTFFFSMFIIYIQGISLQFMKL